LTKNFSYLESSIFII